jgi:hypothetical protein
VDNISYFKNDCAEKLAAIRAHDETTLQMYEHSLRTGVFPEAGTFPARNEARGILCARLEVSVEILLRALS